METFLVFILFLGNAVLLFYAAILIPELFFVALTGEHFNF